MSRKRLLKEANKRVLTSYTQKATLVFIACIGFGALQWLGEQKDIENKARNGRWKAGQRVLAVVETAVAQANSDGKSKAPTLNGDDSFKPSSCAELLDSADQSFGSREQMILAMQERAEACVWGQFRAIVEEPSRNLAKFRNKTNPKSEDFTGFADYIAKEEALATVTAKAARQRVAAQLASMPTQAPPPLKQDKKLVVQSVRKKTIAVRLREEIQSIAAEDNGLHVFYDMLWYASLLLGVVASSMLFLVFLTSLPITSGEGYWTKRISEILERLPTPKMIAVPIMAAAIGGGTLVGAIASTQPGGQGREVTRATTLYDQRTSVTPGAPNPLSPQGQLNQLIDQRSYREGDINTTFFHRREDLAFQSPLVDLNQIKAPLDGINNSTSALITEMRNANRSIALTLQLLAPKVDDAGNKALAEALQRLAALEQREVDLSGRVDKLEPLTETAKKLTATMADREKEITEALKEVKDLEDLERQIAAQSLGQAAEIDPRGFWARTFGKPRYRVGPLVPSIMAAQLADTATPEVKEVVGEVLHEMRGAGPFDEDEFKDELTKRLKGKKRLGEKEVTDFVSDQLSSLLKICALPRQ